MTALYGMMAMMPLIFGGAGYFLVSSDGCSGAATARPGKPTGGRADTNP
ncbi:hypothetical protein QGN32_18185 [Mycolicibacterium sp. ND9-15]|nr:hypothetical protein [Mycolicibacterium sp. ND9-15]WSE55348.1 hypothetical protein QGN32_18185 [Mycolicibacterium sp. ND9-15]